MFNKNTKFVFVKNRVCCEEWKSGNRNSVCCAKIKLAFLYFKNYNIKILVSGIKKI